MRDYLSARVNTSDENRILDVGCGTGHHAKLFHGFFCGIDSNASYVRHAARRHHNRFEHNPTPSVAPEAPAATPNTRHFLVMDAKRLAFAGDNFDVVFCAGLFHHLSDEDARTAAREMLRAAKPGGQIWIIDGVFPRKANLLGYILFALDRGRRLRQFDALARLAAAEGFEPITKNIKGSFPYRRAVFACQKKIHTPHNHTTSS